MRIFLFLIFILITSKLCAQLINIESFRQDVDTSNLYGEVNVGLSYTKNVNEVLLFSNENRIHLFRPKHYWMFINDFSILTGNSGRLINFGYLHMRYNYKIKNSIALEVFNQWQYNQIRLLKLRILTGSGLRFKLIKNEVSKLNLGISIMYEHQEVKFESPFENVIRNSNYLSTSFKFNPNISFNIIGYIQPILNNLQDYRAICNSELVIKASKNLHLQTSFDIFYDNQPPVGIPKQNILFQQGMKLTF